MKAVILSAGEGSRMRPLTFTRPKVMLPVAGKPILEHLILKAKEAGVSEFILVVGYHDEEIRNYFNGGSRLGVAIDYATQRRQLGTASALAQASSLASDKTFLVMNGDAIVGSDDIKNLISKDVTTLSLFEVRDTRELGAVAIEGNRVMHIYEKMENAPSNLANAGIYLFTREIFAAIEKTPKSPRGEYEITESIQIMIDGGIPVSYGIIKYWLDLTYPWDLLNANEVLLADMKGEIKGEVEPNVTLKGEVSIGKGTTVHSGAYIVGPVMIGENCDIGPNCFIRPATVIGNDCHVGAACEVKNSIIMDGSKIPHLNYVGDSIIGKDCNFGAGTKIANLRLDKKNVKINGLDTKRRKLGAIIGDNVQTGINACINVGSMIGNNTFVGPGALASGVIAPDSKIFQGSAGRVRPGVPASRE